MLRYFLKTYRYSSMIESLILSINPIMKALLSVLPLFIGYGFLGMALFWESIRFMNISNSMFTLLALLNGDMIYDTYIDMLQIDKASGLIYLYSFVFISVAVVANIFTIIIEEGFIQQKSKHDFEWLSKNMREHFVEDE